MTRKKPAKKKPEVESVESPQIGGTTAESTDDLKELVESLPDDDLAALYKEAVERIRDGIRGFWMVLPYKKAKLLRGESEWEFDTEGGTIYGYKQLPDVSLLRFVAEQAKGKAGTKETAAKATTLLLKLCIPGHDESVDRYLSTLDDETLAKYDFDNVTLDRIKALR